MSASALSLAAMGVADVHGHRPYAEAMQLRLSGYSVTMTQTGAGQRVRPDEISAAKARRSNAAQVQSHYDLSNEFFALRQDTNRV
jgi:hypothetical protein